MPVSHGVLLCGKAAGLVLSSKELAAAWHKADAVSCGLKSREDLLRARPPVGLRLHAVADELRYGLHCTQTLHQ